MSTTLVRTRSGLYIRRANYSATVLADSPLAYYRLGEPSGTTMTDTSGNGRNGTYGAGVTLGVAGATSDGDKAITVPGVSGGTGNVAFASWMTVTTAHSLECWVKFTTALTFPIFGRDAATVNSQLQTNAGGLAWSIRVTAPNTVVTSPGTYNDGAWHHVVGTYDGANSVLYVDGAQVATTPKTGSISNAANGVAVGGAGTAFLIGSVDECAYYNTVLSAARVAAHHAAR